MVELSISFSTIKTTKSLLKLKAPKPGDKYSLNG